MRHLQIATFHAVVVLAYAMLSTAMAIAVNACHSDCIPFKCHGPTKNNCDKCSTNMVLDVDACACKPGWFDDSGGRCNRSVPNCIQMTIVAGQPYCTQCESKRDTLTNGVCTRSISHPYFLRAGTAYTESTNNANDISYFITNHCKSMSANGTCLECYPGRTLDSSNRCWVVDSYCLRYDSNNNCVKLKPMQWMESLTPPTVSTCFSACKSCTGYGFYDCLSCMPGFYFESASENSITGSCRVCDSICKSCTGPLSTDCTKTWQGKYIDQEDGNKVKSCPANCKICSNATMCTHCASGKTSINGQCSTSISNNILRCVYQFNNDQNCSKCLKYSTNWITGNDGLKYQTTATQVTTIGYCIIESETSTDKITSSCEECVENGLINLQSGFCRSASYPAPPNCGVFVVVDGLGPVCTLCKIGYVLGTNKTCVVDCNPGEGVFTIDTRTVCAKCSYHCNSCAQNGTDMICNECETGYMLYLGFCSSTICGDGFVTLSKNKECDPNNTASTIPCSKDCLKLDADECVGLTCTRKIFNLSVVNATGLELSINDRYQHYVMFDVKPDIILDASTNMIVCNMVLPELDDPTSSCFFKNDSANYYISITASATSVNTLLKKTSTVVNQATMTYWRRFLGGIDFTVSPYCSLSVPKGAIEPQILITTPPMWKVGESLILTYVLQSDTSVATSTTWTVTSLSDNGNIDSAKAHQLNDALLTTGNILPANLLASGYSVRLALTVRFGEQEDDPTVTALHVTLIANKHKHLDLVGDPMVKFGLDKPVNLLYNYSLSVIDPALIVVTVDDVEISDTLYTVKIQCDTKHVIISMMPNTGVDHYRVGVAYADGDYLADYATFIKANNEAYANFIIPTIFSVGQNIAFWTSAGPEVNFKALLFSKTTGAKLAETASTPSTYLNKLSISWSIIEDVRLFVLLTNTSSFLTFNFDVSIAASAPSFDWPVLIGTTYRDGSSLYNAAKTIQHGMMHDYKVLSIPSPTVSSSVLFYKQSTKQFISDTVSLTSTNLKNKIEVGPALNSLTEAGTMITSYKQTYINNQSEFVSMLSRINYFTSASSVTTLTHLRDADVVNVLFAVDTLTSKQHNCRYNCYDGTQAFISVRLTHTMPAAYANVKVMGVAMSAFGRHDVFRLQPFMFNILTTPLFRPQLSVYLFDNDAFAVSDSYTIQPTEGWSPSSQSVSSYLANRNSKLSTQTGGEFMRNMNLGVFQVNQAYLTCRYNLNGVGCSQDMLAVAGSRRELLEKFWSFWNTIADKYAWQNWENSVSKNSFLEAISLESRWMTDEEIKTFDQELARETNDLYAKVKSIRSSEIRTSYGLIERMKPISIINKLNLEYLLSAASHDLRLFTNSKTVVTGANQTQDKLNSLYKDILCLNELRLIRYCHISDVITFENEVMLVGGVTLIEPVQDTYTFWFGEGTAIELKNLKFNMTLDAYELSMVQFKDEYFDELKGRLQDYNFSVEMDQSRTSVGFTNDFNLVGLKNDSNTEINIFRELSACRGTPCNINRKMNIGVEVILCQCLKTGNGNTFTDLARQSLQVSEKVSDGAVQTFKDIVKKDSYTNYRVWLSSVIIIFLALTVLMVTVLVLESKLISPFAKGMSTRFSCELMVHEKLMAMNKLSKANSGETSRIQRQNSSLPLQSQNSNDSDSTENTSGSESAKQTTQLVKQLKKVYKDDPVMMRAIESKPLKPLTNLRLFMIVMLTHHDLLSIFCTQSVFYERRTMICQLYLRYVYNLALTMLLTMGVDKDGFSSYQNFFLKCIFTPIIVSFVLVGLKKLMKNETQYGLCIIPDFCKPKPTKLPSNSVSSSSIRTSGIQSASPLSPARSTATACNNSSRLSSKKKTNFAHLSSSDIRANVKSGTGGRSGSKNLSGFSGSSGGAHLDHTPLPTPASPANVLKIDLIEKDFKKTILGKVVVIIGYILTYALIPLSMLTIYVISARTNQNQMWPFGYWFFLQSLSSMTIGAMPAILVQFVSMLIHLANRANPGTWLQSIASYNFMFNSNLARLTKASDSVAVNKKK